MVGSTRPARARCWRGILGASRAGLGEGEEVIVKIEGAGGRDEIVERYKGFMGGIGEDGLEELAERVELVKL